MVNYAALLERIRESGIKRTVLAERLGCTAPTLRAKLQGRSLLTVGDVQVLAKVLGLNSRDIKSIFFAAKSDS